MQHAFFLMAMLLASCNPEADQTHHIASPDERIQVGVSLDGGVPRYRVEVDGIELVKPSRLGFRLREGADLVGPFQLVQLSRESMEETWQPVWGQEKRIHSHSHTITLQLKEVNSPHRDLGLHFRVFDDGVAFRYEIPEQAGYDSLFILEELSEFNFAQDGKAWWIPGGHAFDTYEQLHQVGPLNAVDSANTPFTYKTQGGYYISIHEAALTDYAGMTLKQSVSDPLSFSSYLVPWPDGDKVKTSTPMVSPWRTITIGRKATDLLRSRMILNLNEPRQIADASWIKPMKYIGIWWGMHINKYTWVQGNKHGATTENVKRYIDFASENNIQGVLAEGWNEGWEKWGQEGALQLTEPYDDFHIEEVVDYAREKNVTFIGHHETTANVTAYEAQLDTAYQYYADLGITAVKTGYVGPIKPAGHFHYGQWMVNHFRRVVELAAKHKITLDVHEPVKGTGVERTWPNMMTREGARGQEWNAWSEGNPPDHTTILPFTRLLAGPMDYTPGIFDLTFDELKPDNRVHSTLAKQLALMVVLYSPLQMAADLPENYVDNPAFQFIRDLETDWAETIYLDGEIGEHVVLARRHEKTWFIGAITNEDARVVDIPLEDMIKENMLAECYVDAAGADWDNNPYKIHIGTYLATPSERIRAKLAPGGGLAIRLVPFNGNTADLPSVSQLLNDQE